MSFQYRLPQGLPTMHCNDMVQPEAKAINKVSRGGFQTTAVSTLTLRVSTWLPQRSETLMTGPLGERPADWLRAGASNHTGEDHRAARGDRFGALQVGRLCARRAVTSAYEVPPAAFGTAGQ